MFNQRQLRQRNIDFNKKLLAILFTFFYSSLDYYRGKKFILIPYLFKVAVFLSLTFFIYPFLRKFFISRGILSREYLYSNRGSSFLAIITTPFTFLFAYLLI